MSDDLYQGDESSPFLTHFIGRVSKGFWSTFFAETEGKATGDYAQDVVWFSHVEVLDILQANYEAAGPPIETVTVSLGIGKGWQMDPNDPNLVEHEDDSESKRKQFAAPSGHSDGCAYMKVAYLIAGRTTEYQGAAVMDGDSERIDYDMQGVRKVHAERGIKTLRDASLYDNCIFEYRGLGFPTRQTPKPRAKPFPVRYLGYDENEIVDISTLGGASGHSTTNSQSGARPALGSVPAEVVAGWQEAGASDPTISVLTRLWESSPSLEHFVRNAGNVPAVKDSEALVNAVLNSEVVVESAAQAATE